MPASSEGIHPVHVRKAHHADGHIVQSDSESGHTGSICDWYYSTLNVTGTVNP